MNTITKIQDWYHEQCDDEWEHEFGINIQTIDNPGWLIKIDLKKTNLENKQFDIIHQNVSKEFIDQATGKTTPFHCAEPLANDWHICFIKDNTYTGVGDPTKLEHILEIFVNWKNQKL